MALGRWQRTIADGEGNVLPGASVTVRRHVAGLPTPTIYSDRDGATPIANPFLADANGFAAFHAAGGPYRITATKGAFTQTWDYEPIGTAQELDSEDGETIAVSSAVKFLFDTPTIDADPGLGALRLNHATLASVTAAYVDNANKDGLDVSAWLDTFDSWGFSAERGALHIYKTGSQGENFRIYRLTGNVVDGTGYRKLTLEHIAGAGSFAALDSLDVMFYPLMSIPVDIDGTLAANSDLVVPSQKAVKTYADQLLAANDALVFKGNIDASGNPNYPAADCGHVYRVSVAGKIGGASGPNVEVNDLITCRVDSTAAGDHATVGANWSITQTNIDGAVTGPASATTLRLAVFSGTSGKVIDQAPVTLAGLPKNSIETNADQLQLVGDQTAPGNDKVYGTDGSGNKGWKPDPSGAVIGFSVHNNGVDQTGLTDNTFVQLTFSTEVYDVGGHFASSIWTPPAGKIMIKAAAFIAGTVVTGNPCAIAIYKNGVAFKQTTWVATSQNGGGSVYIDIDDLANGTDTYAFAVLLDVSAGTGTVLGSSLYTWAMGRWLGP